MKKIMYGLQTKEKVDRTKALLYKKFVLPSLGEMSV